MRPVAILIALAFWWSTPAVTQSDMPGIESVDASNRDDLPTGIAINVNPEARVSVSRSGAITLTSSCSEPIAIPVVIVNQAFLTDSLEARTVGHAPKSTVVTFPHEPLKGTPIEHRTLQISVKRSALIDVTLAFRASGDMPDLGGRDRVHFLIRCT